MPLVIGVALVGATVVCASVASAQTWGTPGPSVLAISYIPPAVAPLADTVSQEIQLTVIEQGQTPPTTAPAGPGAGAGAGGSVPEGEAATGAATGPGGASSDAPVTALPRTGPNDYLYWVAFVALLVLDLGWALERASRARRDRPPLTLLAGVPA